MAWGKTTLQIVSGLIAYVKISEVRSYFMSDLSRRDALISLATGSAGLSLTLGADIANAQTTAGAAATRAFRAQHQPQPLPFNPARLTGLSEKPRSTHTVTMPGRMKKRVLSAAQSLMFRRRGVLVLMLPNHGSRWLMKLRRRKRAKLNCVRRWYITKSGARSRARGEGFSC